MTYEELVEEATKLGMRVIPRSGSTNIINPFKFMDRPVSRIAATLIANSTNPTVSDEMARAVGVKSKHSLWVKLIRNSFNVAQFSRLTKYCGGKLIVQYPDGESEEIFIEEGKEDG